MTAPAKCRFSVLLKSLGAVVVGDVVLLEANLLEDIRAVGYVDTVVLAGTVCGKADLDWVRAEVTRATAHWSMRPKVARQLRNSPIMRREFADWRRPRRGPCEAGLAPSGWGPWG